MSDRIASSLSRRELLQIAGGITFCALIPLETETGAFAATFGNGSLMKTGATEKPAALPLFTALPYLQAGARSSKLVDGKEIIVIAWQTNSTDAKFELEFGSQELAHKATITRQERLSVPVQGDNKRFNYVATLTGLNLNRRYNYRVRMNGEKLLEGYFTTRKPRGVKTRFVAFGDNSCGDPSDHAIAYYAYKANPDFVMNTGDNVYDRGRDSEYAQNFFPVYNADTASEKTGAPLLRSVPYYSVIANHDVTKNDAERRIGLDFSSYVDGGAYYTNWHFPLNGPTPSHPTIAFGEAAPTAHFKTCAGARYPDMANYSYDYGDAHFLCLDSNVYVDPTDAKLHQWIAQDLASTDATWKIVVYHHPAFNAGYKHYAEQHMRVLSPIFEKHGVTLVLSGHEHNYQRTRPFRFAPTDESGAKALNGSKRLVPGKFTVDTQFDGKTVTKPNGIVYITTGAGGKELYDAECNNNPEKWRHPEDNNVEYVARMITDTHSLTIIDMDGKSLLITQIDEKGKEIDRCSITKA